MLPERLAREVEKLGASFPELEVVEETGTINIIIRQFPTSDLYNRQATTLLLRLPRAYPEAGPDMFWTDPDLALKDGRIPQNGDAIESHLGRAWRRFSWHHNRWRPSTENLESYLAFVRRRFDRP